MRWARYVEREGRGGGNMYSIIIRIFKGERYLGDTFLHLYMRGMY